MSEEDYAKRANDPAMDGVESMGEIVMYDWNDYFL